MRIYAPNREYTGISAGVPFLSGIGETDDPRLLQWFRTHGYRVEQPDPESPEEPDPEPPGQAMENIQPVKPKK